MWYQCNTVVFLSTLSLRRATGNPEPGRDLGSDFYPRSPCGERPITCCLHMRHAVFLSTLSLRRATLRVVDGSKSSIISIHALLAESDLNLPSKPIDKNISIHALLAESDLAGPSGPAFLYNFYPRSPCGERHNVRPETRQLCAISIHALLAESDHFSFYSQQWHFPFLSTLSLRRATYIMTIIICTVSFLSTLSLRRATKANTGSNESSEFLSTLSLRRATLLLCLSFFGKLLFLSTLSLRRATSASRYLSIPS